MFFNDVLQLIIFLNDLPKETHERILLFIQIFLILADIVVFFYIRHMTKEK